LELVAEVLGGVQFLVGAAAAFFEGLHPEGFGDVGDGFGGPAKRVRPRRKVMYEMYDSYIILNMYRRKIYALHICDGR